LGESADYKAQYGDWAMVIGGSVGLGEALARELARRGMNVAITARGAEKLAIAAERLRADFGVEVKTIAADLADPDILNKLVAGMDGTPVDFLVYNAASEHIGEFLAQNLERHLENIAINCTVPTVLVHRFAGEMAARGRGGIVLCSSLGGAQGMYSLSTYGASKSYENLLAQALWYELKPHGVGVTSFMIGSTYTPNFQRNQKIRATPFAESRTPEGLPEGTPVPQDPEEAAANLFLQLDKEWLPVVFANPRDEANAAMMASMPLAERITMVSEVARASFAAAPGASEGKPLVM